MQGLASAVPMAMLADSFYAASIASDQTLAEDIGPTFVAFFVIGLIMFAFAAGLCHESV